MIRNYGGFKPGQKVRLVLDEDSDLVTRGMLAHNGEEFTVRSSGITGIRLTGFRSKLGIPYYVPPEMLEIIN